jgi:hypothetical protein
VLSAIDEAAMLELLVELLVVMQRVAPPALPEQATFEVQYEAHIKYADKMPKSETGGHPRGCGL